MTSVVLDALYEVMEGELVLRDEVDVLVPRYNRPTAVLEGTGGDLRFTMDSMVATVEGRVLIDVGSFAQWDGY